MAALVVDKAQYIATSVRGSHDRACAEAEVNRVAGRRLCYDNAVAFVVHEVPRRQVTPAASAGIERVPAAIHEQAPRRVAHGGGGGCHWMELKLPVPGCLGEIGAQAVRFCV